MARRPSTRRRTGTYGRRTSTRSSYGRRPVRRATSRRATRSGGARTIRIEVVSSAAPAARPVIGMKPASAPYKRSF